MLDRGFVVHGASMPAWDSGCASRLDIGLSGRPIEQQAQFVEHIATQHDLVALFITDHENTG